MIHSIQEQREADGTFALQTIHEGRSTSLAVRGLPDGSSRVAAKLLLELADAARDAGKVDERGDVWVIRARGIDLAVAVERLAQPGFFGFLKPPSALLLRDVGGDGRLPSVSMASALAVEGLGHLRSGALVAAREAFERSIELRPGDTERPDDLDARRGNHENHVSYLGLSRVAEEEGDWERAITMLREGLRRSWAAQMQTVGGRLQKIERSVPRHALLESLRVLARGPLMLFDRLKKRRSARGVVVVPSPVHTFGERGRAVLPMIEVPKRWTSMFYEGVGRRAAEDPATVELAAEAIEAHLGDVAPLVLVTRSYPLFERRAEGVELPAEYFPPFQLWSSVIASIAAWTTAGLTRDEMRAMLSLERDRALRDAGAAKWRSFAAALERDKQAVATAS